MFRISSRFRRLFVIGGVVALAVSLGIVAFLPPGPANQPERLVYQPRQPVETSGFLAVFHAIDPWHRDASLEDYAAAYEQAPFRGFASVERHLENGFHPMMLMQKRACTTHKEIQPRHTRHSKTCNGGSPGLPGKRSGSTALFTTRA